MNDPISDLDDGIQKILAWRSVQATPGSLLNDIRKELEMEPQAHGTPVWRVALPRLGSVAWIGLLLAIVAAVAVAGFAGSRPSVAPPVASQTSLPSTGQVFCTARSLPFSAGVALTGAWTDRNQVYYLTEDGSVLWGVGTFVIGHSQTLPISGFGWAAMRGTIQPGSTISLDWAETGTVAPSESATPRKGSIVLRIQAATDGNAELVLVSQSGFPMTGPGNSSPIFSPCTPSNTP